MISRGDDRGVSTIVGAVLLIGVLVVLLSVYQATIIPQQNREIEFDHNQQVQNDMLDLRNAILEAKSIGDPTFAEVLLGTDYPPRIVGLNPPAATGALRTGQPREIEVFNETGTQLSNLCSGPDPIETRYLTYEANYNQYRNPPTIVYENTVTYLNFSGDIVLLTDETLIRGDTFYVSPLNSSFSEQGVATTSVEPVPGHVKDRDVTGAVVEFPSRLSADTWRNLLAEDMDEIDQISKIDGQIRVEMVPGSSISLSCSPVGLNQSPAGGARDEDDDPNINPVAPNDIQLINLELSSNKQVITATFRNNNEDTEAKISQVRLAFYHTPDGIDEMEITELGNTTSPTLRLPLLGGFQSADPDYEIPRNTQPGTDAENSIEFEFRPYDSSAQQPQQTFDRQQDWFSIQIIFDNGVTATYFVAAEDFGTQ